MDLNYLRRQVRPVVLRAIAAICLTTALAAGITTAARAVAGSSDAPAAEQDTAPVSVTLYHDTLEWHTLPHHFATAYVTHTEGIVSDGRGGEIGRTGVGNGRADGQGRVSVRLTDGQGRSQRWLPFDKMTLHTSNFTTSVGPSYAVDVPELRVDVSADRGSIVGRAAPGTSVALLVDAAPAGGGPVGETVVVADADGRFVWRPPDGAALLPGQGGWATVVDAAGNRFRARFAALAVRLMIGQAAASGWLTPADALVVYDQVRHADGRRVPRRINMTNRTPEGLRRGERQSSSPLTPGETFTLTVDSPVLGPRTLRGVPLPALAIDSLTATRATGSAPADLPLTLELYAPDTDDEQPPFTRLPITAGADGRWEAAWPAEAPLLAGGRALVVTNLGDGIEAAATAVRPRFTVAVDGGRIDAQFPPNARFSVKVLAPNGDAIGHSGVMGAGADGRESLDFSPDDGHWSSGPRLPAGALSALLPGGTVEVDLGTGDPTRLSIPQLTATSDVERDRIAGMAPPAAALDVEVLAPGETLRFAVTADDVGRWSLDLAGRVDVALGVGARIRFVDRAGHRYQIDTAPVRIVAYPDSLHLAAAPWTGRPFRAEVRDRNGRLVATASHLADKGPDEDDRRQALTATQGQWLVDTLGEEPPMLAGDTLWVRIGDDEATWVLPPIEGRIHPDRDLVVGATDPGAAVEVISGELDDPLAVVVPAVADASGIFRAEFAGSADIEYGSGVHVRRHDGHHDLLRYINAPGIFVHADRAFVEGTLEPHVAIDVRLEDAGGVRATGRAMSGSSAGFSAWLRDAGGEPVVPRTGERIVVESAEAQLFGRMDFVIPPLGIEVEADRRTVGGPRPAAAYFSAGAGRVYYDWPLANAASYVYFDTLPADPGRWQGRLREALGPGISIGATAYLGSGHGISRERVQPILAIELGGPHVCGLVQPFAAIRLVLEAGDGSPRAVLETRDGLDLRWLDAQGRPVNSRAGDRVTGRIGDTDIDIPLGVLTATIDVAAGTLTGQIRPGGTPILTAPARDCQFRLSGADSRWLADTGNRPAFESYGFGGAPPDGRIRLALPAPALADRGIDLHVDSAEGHRIYRRVHRPLRLVADVASGAVTGEAAPAADVSLTLLGPDGRPRGSATAASDTGGLFEARIVDATGAVVAPAPGDRITAEAATAPGADVVQAGVQSAVMTVELLDVDPSAAAIVGRAPAGRDVALVLTGRGVGVRRIKLQAASDGRFAFRSDDLPPRSGWTLADVSAGRVELEQTGGHRTVASWSMERQAHAPIHLPWLGRGH